MVIVGHDMDVGRLTSLMILVGPEEVPIRTGAVNGGHADLADWSAEADHGRVRFTLAYLANPHADGGKAEVGPEA